MKYNNLYLKYFSDTNWNYVKSEILFKEVELHPRICTVRKFFRS